MEPVDVASVEDLTTSAVKQDAEAKGFIAFKQAIAGKTQQFRTEFAEVIEKWANGVNGLVPGSVEFTPNDFGGLVKFRVGAMSYQFYDARKVDIRFRLEGQQDWPSVFTFVSGTRDRTVEQIEKGEYTIRWLSQDDSQTLVEGVDDLARWAIFIFLASIDRRV